MAKWTFRDRNQKRKWTIAIAVAAVVLVAIIVCAIVFFGGKSEDKKDGKDNNETVSKEELNGDPEEMLENEKDPEEPMEEFDVVIPPHETADLTIGVDVAKYQGNIDWKQVANAGIDFAMVRVGYRTMGNGAITEDSSAKYNLQEATKYGIHVGAYFFSTAITEQEAIEEANWVADYISKYQITYPVAYNCEGFDKADSRQYSMTKSQRTDAALAFLKRIAERGYYGMFYAAKNEMEEDAKWETSRIEKDYKIWVAQYAHPPYPETGKSSYAGVHAMWQYTNQGIIAGISQPVDVNVAYFGYNQAQGPQDNSGAEVVGKDPEAMMNFKSVNEKVTAKEETNLRNLPSQGSDSKVMYTLKNGEVATRTGIDASGWSRVVFHGKTYYAVSSYLTTDLNYQVKPPQVDTGFNTKFTEVNEQVTAKEEVNLRTMPSVTDSNSQVVASIKNGEVITRTGINTELGFSRVLYNGQTLYCVSSYLMMVN